jgi:hypothetical protein
MDARKMEYVPDQCFDLILDKGLLDTLLCSENNLRDMEAYLREAHFLQSHLINMDIDVQSISKLLSYLSYLPITDIN